MHAVWLVSAVTAQLKLGQAGDWATVIGLFVAVLGLLGAVWKLARAATNLETAVLALTHQQADMEESSRKQNDRCEEFQKTTNAVIQDMRLTISKLTWELERSRESGSGTNPGIRNPLTG